MSLETQVDRRRKVERSQLLDDVTHVVFKVIKYNNRSMWVLSINISDDFRDPLSYLF